MHHVLSSKFIFNGDVDPDADVAAADIMLMLLVADVADMMCEVCSGVSSVGGRVD